MWSQVLKINLSTLSCSGFGDGLWISGWQSDGFSSQDSCRTVLMWETIGGRPLMILIWKWNTQQLFFPWLQCSLSSWMGRTWCACLMGTMSLLADKCYICWLFFLVISSSGCKNWYHGTYVWWLTLLMKLTFFISVPELIILFMIAIVPLSQNGSSLSIKLGCEWPNRQSTLGTIVDVRSLLFTENKFQYLPPNICEYKHT